MKGVKQINKTLEAILVNDDKESFEILYNQYRDHILIFATVKYKELKKTHSYLEVQDIENEIWLQLWLYLRTNRVTLNKREDFVLLIEKIADKTYNSLLERL